MSHYDLCSNNLLKRRRVHSVWPGTESVSYLGPKIWDLVPNEIKESELPMLSNSKSKDGSLKDVHTEYAKYISDSGGYNNIEKLVLSETKLYVVTIIIVLKCSIISDYYSSYVLPLILVFFLFFNVG